MLLDTLTSWAASNPLVASSIVLALSFLCVVKSSDYLLTSITGFSHKIGVSDYLIGFLIMGIGTSMPELLSALIGNEMGEPGIVFGTVLGSGVTTVTMVLGTLALVGRSIRLDDKLLAKTRFLIVPLCALPLILSWDGTLSRWDGILLIAAFIGFVTLAWKHEGTMGHVKTDVRMTHIWKEGVVFLMGLAVLLISVRFLVAYSIVLAHILHIPTYLMALTFIAIGSSVGDLAVDVRSLLNRHRNVAIGGLLGGLVFENTLLYGVVAMVRPVSISISTLAPAAFFFLMPLMGIMMLVHKGKMDRRHGVWLLSTYFAFLVVQIILVP